MLRAISFLLLLSLFGCQSDQSTTEERSTVVIRLPTEPDMLNPARSASSYATQIESQIFLPLAEFDPGTYQLEPLLVEQIPEPVSISAGIDSGGVLFHYDMRKEARWEDGTPVTAADYAFTVKMVLNPLVDVEQWRGFLTFISDVRIDPDDARAFDVIIGEQYILADVVTCNFNIYPKHIYDPEGYLDDISLRDLTDSKKADSLTKASPVLKQFADGFMQSRFANEVVVGSGPYKLASWETGQRIVLERTADWWGDAVEDAPSLLHGYPQQLIYEIVPDENTALTMLKDGTVDVMSEVSPGNFVALKADSAFQNQLDFFTPKLNVYYFLLVNNHKPILRDRNVRRALAHLLDYDGIVRDLAHGMGARTTGPFHPDVDYYNSSIAQVEYSLEKARALLQNGGWTDTNNNGTLDKVLDGQVTELELSITVTQSALGQGIALLMKEQAAKAGIGITLSVRDGASFGQDIRARNFDIATARNDSPITLSDPFQSWHSSSDAPGGANRAGFRNPVADSLITIIRSTRDVVARNTAYMAFQEVLASEQPVIFLYTPLERIIVNKRFNVNPSARRPGYFEHLFRLSGRNNTPAQG